MNKLVLYARIRRGGGSFIIRFPKVYEEFAEENYGKMCKVTVEVVEG